MSPKVLFSLIIVGVLVIVGSQFFFTVNQTEQVIVLQFGEVKKVIKEPGLKTKLPFVQNIIYIDKRLLNLDLPTEEVIASDQERLIVDAFARFQIVDPLKYFQTVNNETNARQRMSRFLNSTLRRVLGAVSSNDIVSGQRADLMNVIEQGVNRQADAAGLGIAIRDVRIRHVDLPQANSEAIYNRMKSERQQQAAQFRAVGEEKARRIRAEAERQKTVLLARAREEGQIKRGQGDAIRNAIFACAFGADPDFFSFYRSMQAYEKSFSNTDTTMVLSPDSRFFQFFVNPAGTTDTLQIPAPKKSAAASKDHRCGADGAYDLTGIDFLAASAAPPKDLLPLPEVDGQKE